VNARLLDRWLPAGVHFDRILKTDAFDEASGDGLFPHLAARATQVVEIDISHVTLLAARQRHPELRGIDADVRSLPFCENAFDAIVSNSTLDHFATLAELEAAIGELFRVLRPGGTLVLTLDNPTNPAVGLRNAMPFAWMNRSGLVPYFVGATCGWRKLQRMLQARGFAIRAVDAVLHCPRVLAVHAAKFVGESSANSSNGKFLRCLMSFERLAWLPTRFLTGYFTAVLAQKPTA
jgi:SAM-dependent methyltransferase